MKGCGYAEPFSVCRLSRPEAEGANRAKGVTPFRSLLTLALLIRPVFVPDGVLPGVAAGLVPCAFLDHARHCVPQPHL